MISGVKSLLARSLKYQSAELIPFGSQLTLGVGDRVEGQLGGGGGGRRVWEGYSVRVNRLKSE